MRLSLRDSLPFVTVILSQGGKQIQIPNVLVDTGSGGTIFSADKMEQIGITPQVDDVLHHVYGVGGSEVVFMRRVEKLQVGEYTGLDLEIEVGGLDYGFELGGILGMDFLLVSGALIDVQKLTIEFQS